MTNPDGGALFGYGSFPYSYSITPKLDGVTVVYDTLPGGAIRNFNLGRVSFNLSSLVFHLIALPQTATHGVGHWFGLFHTFQEGCDSGLGDLVDDTPPEATPGGACQERSTCPGGRPDPIRMSSFFHPIVY